MRALFVTDQQVSHFHPLVPIARALEAMGHLVGFASSQDLASTIEACGFRFFPIGPAARELPDLIAWCDEWNPDAIVTASTASAGAMAAERCQIPYANLKPDEPASPAVIVDAVQQLVLKRQPDRADSHDF